MNAAGPEADALVRAGLSARAVGRYRVVGASESPGPGSDYKDPPRLPTRLPSLAACRAVADGAPLLSIACIAALACGLYTSDLGPWPIAWALGGAVMALAWSVAAAWPNRRSIQASLPRYCLTLSVWTVLLLGWFVVLPVLASDRPASVELLLLRYSALAMVACCAAFVFAPLIKLAAVALALMPLQLLAGPSTPLLWLHASLSMTMAGALTLAARRAWLRRVHSQADAERRIASAEARCNDAIHADQDKTRFLSATSHDLRQPVHALGLFAATLDKRLHGTRDEALVRNVVRSIEGLDRSLNAMLDVSRLDAGAVEPNFQHFPLRDLFRRLHMQFAGQADLAGLTLRFSPGGKWVTSDPQLLERIMANLIQNAMKYTAHGGVVIVARSTATHFNLEVWDTGVGIAPAELPRIFDEYYQVSGHKALRQQGMGMGLSIVRRLVRLLGHQLTVASQTGRGTMFRLSIAQGGTPDVQDLTAPADTQPMPAGRVRTVLVVEDDDAVREGLALLLEESGYAALQASSLEEARQTLRMLELPPDLLLTDLRLGSGPGGLDVIQELRRECGFELPVIVITGDTATDEVRQLCEGPHPVLFKPVDPRKLLLRIRSLVA